MFEPRNEGFAVNTSTRIAIAATLAAAALLSSAAQADESPWVVRLRAVNLSPANKSDAAEGLPADAIHINSKWLPDVDFEYFFSPHWSGELVLTYPQSQTVSVAGQDIGTFKHLPPVLTAKYNFNPAGTFRPYLGVGVNITLISNVDLAGGAVTLSKSSVGPAVQAGFDFKLADHWFVNADIKWAQIRSDVNVDNVKISEVKIDPVLSGVGIAYRF